LLRKQSDKFCLLGFSVHRNVEMATAIAAEFRPTYCAVSGLGESDFPRHLSLKFLPLCELAAIAEADCVAIAIGGIAALDPLMAAIGAGKCIILANKESIVSAGPIVGDALLKSKATLLPADSEHCGIFQCMRGDGGFRGLFRRTETVRHVWLTASGGPFFDAEGDRLNDVKPAEALRHPTWSMGAKISVDSATLANKGLEVIEAGFLYGLSPEEISVVIHRRSLVHALVEFCDGSLLAQMSQASMEIPLSYCLSYPDRAAAPEKAFNPVDSGPLEFQYPNRKSFPCLALAESAFRNGLSATCAFDGANCAAVEAFMREEVPFGAIPMAIGHVLHNLPPQRLSDIESAKECHCEAKRKAAEFLGRRFSI
jgi:1-deoxy-D-xylulose-5-phosphate reductoisomerase